MKRGTFKLLFSVLLLGLVIPVISAEIYIADLQSLYNVGDKVIANVTISSSVDTAGFFTAYLICGFNEIEAYKSIESINAGEENIISVKSILDNSIVGDISGECFVRALYGSGEARSQLFKVSRKAIVEVALNDALFSPGDVINVSGRIIKENREPLNGFADIVIEGIDVKIPSISNSEESPNETAENETIQASNETEESLNETSSETEEAEETESNETEVEENEEQQETAEETKAPVNQTIILGSFNVEVMDGFYSASFQIPENAPPGIYSINVYAFDQDRNGIIMSSGAASNQIRISQVIRDIDITLSASSVKPESEFYYIPLLYDQAGNYGEGDVEVTIYKPDKSIFLQRLLKASELNPLYVESNFTPGFWEAQARYETFEIKKTFFIEEFTKISSTIENGMLVVTNAGNIPYKGPLEITIGDKSQVRNIALETGESIRFELEAPDGEYDIKINDGKNLQNLGKMFLTGNAIGVNEVKGLLFGSAGVWLWTLLIVILLIVILVLIRKIIRRRYMGKAPKIITPSMRTVTSTISAPTISSVINSGSKEEASIIALKIRNISALQRIIGVGNPLEDIDKALLQAKAARAKIYVDNDYRIIIFIPSVTRSSENDIKALNVAKDIELIMQNHNKVSANKIDFGIGVHSGSMAVESKEGRLKFVSLDNTIAIAKRVADYSKGFVLLSEQVNRKFLGKLKVEKLEGTSYWRLQKLANRTNYEDFVQRFLNRQKNRE